MKAGKGANRDRVITLLRQADTAAVTTHGIGGRKKTRPRPKPTLPRLKCLEEDAPAISTPKREA